MIEVKLRDRLLESSMETRPAMAVGRGMVFPSYRGPSFVVAIPRNEAP